MELGPGKHQKMELDAVHFSQATQILVAGAAFVKAWVVAAFVKAWVVAAFFQSQLLTPIQVATFETLVVAVPFLEETKSLVAEAASEETRASWMTAALHTVVAASYQNLQNVGEKQPALQSCQIAVAEVEHAVIDVLQRFHGSAVLVIHQSFRIAAAEVEVDAVLRNFRIAAADVAEWVDEEAWELQSFQIAFEKEQEMEFAGLHIAQSAPEEQEQVADRHVPNAAEQNVVAQTAQIDVADAGKEELLKSRNAAEPQELMNPDVVHQNWQNCWFVWSRNQQESH